MRFPALLSRTDAISATALVVGAGLVSLCVAIPAQAATGSTPAPAAASPTLESKALTVAQHQVGKPFRAGATGPDAFDASGLTFYAFKQAGRTLPHNALAQYRAIRHLSLSQIKPGDLVFMARSGSSKNSSQIDHVGVYAGSNAWYVARRPGTTVTHQTLWTRNLWVGRP